MSLKKRISDLEQKLSDFISREAKSNTFLNRELKKTNSRLDSLEEKKESPLTMTATAMRVAREQSDWYNDQIRVMKEKCHPSNSMIQSVIFEDGKVVIKDIDPKDFCKKDLSPITLENDPTKEEYWWGESKISTGGIGQFQEMALKDNYRTIQSLKTQLQARAESAKVQSSEIHDLKALNAGLVYKYKKTKTQLKAARNEREGYFESAKKWEKESSDLKARLLNSNGNFQRALSETLGMRETVESLKKENSDHNKTIKILLSEIEGLKTITEAYKKKSKNAEQALFNAKRVLNDNYDIGEFNMGIIFGE